VIRQLSASLIQRHVRAATTTARVSVLMRLHSAGWGGSAMAFSEEHLRRMSESARARPPRSGTGVKGVTWAKDRG